VPDQVDRGGERAEELLDRGDVLVEREVRVGGPRRVLARPEEVGQHHAVVGREGIGQAAPLPPGHAAAVEQDHRGPVAARLVSEHGPAVL
jgi:hypothetical protein